ncbi:hypothetical protein Pmani_030465 [Petrolisthes manimaculis]|uniref:Uncharacterized protein n=1 Tax=Petrolisthes manimaculis TaxID=1843537 RepID=A0AAE1NX60_9EUCA|nr:hypothetical protein Pmani_030465 [Petrolisthes manimaculis]
MRATSSQERVGRVSRCCAQGRMSSMANSMRNVRLRSYNTHPIPPDMSRIRDFIIHHMLADMSGIPDIVALQL